MIGGMVLSLLGGLWLLTLHVSSSGSFPRPLTARQERECLERMKNGDRAARIDRDRDLIGKAGRHRCDRYIPRNRRNADRAVAVRFGSDVHTTHSHGTTTWE